MLQLEILHQQIQLILLLVLVKEDGNYMKKNLLHLQHLQVQQLLLNFLTHKKAQVQEQILDYILM